MKEQRLVQRQCFVLSKPVLWKTQTFLIYERFVMWRICGEF